MVQFFIICFQLCWFAVSVRNRNPFLAIFFHDPLSKVFGGGGGGGGGGSVHAEHHKSPESHNCTRGVFSYFRPRLNNLHFGPSL